MVFVVVAMVVVVALRWVVRGEGLAVILKEQVLVLELHGVAWSCMELHETVNCPFIILVRDF